MSSPLFLFFLLLQDPLKTHFAQLALKIVFFVEFIVPQGYPPKSADILFRPGRHPAYLFRGLTILVSNLRT